MTGAEFEGVDFDLLADYVGGALDGTADEQRVAELVAGDPAWRAAYERLVPAMSTVGAMLLDLPPEPMPDDLAARLDGLFSTPAAEQPAPHASAAGASGESADPVPNRVLDLDERRRDRAARAGGRRWSRWAAPTAVAAGVLAFAGFGLSQFGDQAQEDSAASVAPAGAGQAQEAEGVAPMVADTPSIGQILHSGTDYTAGTLDRIAVTGRESPAAPFGSAETGAAKRELDRLLPSDPLIACLDAIATENAGGPISAQVVDYATFEGEPALIVHFSAANGIWAWAVGADCGTQGAGAAQLAKLPVR